MLALIAACGGTSRPPQGPTGPTGSGRPVKIQHGKATWYGGKHHGGPTASGERYNKHAMTAAHRTIKMNTWVRVTNKRNGRSVVVRINDRGPYGKGRIIDVSEAAARRLDMIEAGVVPCIVEVLR
ncbi:MAG: septal ring lytic transglycosylase RlpA family protein [Kofleriaceae bacterium]